MVEHTPCDPKIGGLNPIWSCVFIFSFSISVSYKCVLKQMLRTDFSLKRCSVEQLGANQAFFKLAQSVEQIRVWANFGQKIEQTFGQLFPHKPLLSTADIICVSVLSK